MFEGEKSAGSILFKNILFKEVRKNFVSLKQLGLSKNND